MNTQINLKIGDVSDNSQVTILDEDKLSYLVESNSRGAVGVRTISKNLLREYINYLLSHPNATPDEIRGALSGTSNIDKFEYGYTSTLTTMAKMSIANQHRKNPSSSKLSALCPLQQIFYGAPGTGKSHKVNKEIQNTSNAFVFRTTFHPDSDYSTFVGAYKPTMKSADRLYSADELIDKLSEIKTLGHTYPCHKFAAKYWYSLKGLSAADIKRIVVACDFPESMTVEVGKGIAIGEEMAKHVQNDKIVYSFVPQAFLKAYVAAWQNPEQPVFLVIEEINRGNCAQIFGDIFQLLDRKDGVSEYPIKADQDIRDYLAKEFAGYDLEANILSGEELVLPANLHIWATMNTSDQSLFPIDSAFKRRWDWKYVPIQDGGKKWGIQVNGLEYDWWSFLEKINDLIDSTTSSEDKKLGYFFCKPDDDKSVTADKFVNKVIFYLWNDVFKDYDMSHEAFKDENKRLAFGKFFKNDGNVNENVVMTFLDKLGVSLKGSYDSDEEEDMANLTQDEKNLKDSKLAENCKNFWQLFNESDLHKRGFNSAMGYVRGIVINGTTILIELPRNSKRSHTNTIKFVAQFNQHSLPTLTLPNDKDNIQWIQKTTADKDRIELHLTDVTFDNLIEKANNDLFERLSQQLDEFVQFIEKEGLSTSNNK